MFGFSVQEGRKAEGKPPREIFSLLRGAKCIPKAASRLFERKWEWPGTTP
jgi:hypothetical protein